MAFNTVYGTVYGFQCLEQLPFVGCCAVHAKPGDEFVSTFAIAFGEADVSSEHQYAENYNAKELALDAFDVSGFVGTV